MKSLTWQAIALAGLAIAGFNATAAGLVAYFLGRRQQKTDAKIDQVIEQTNGHHDDGGVGQHRPQEDDRPAGRPGTTLR